MPLSSGSKALANKLTNTPEAKTRQRIRTLMSQRSEVSRELREFESENADILETIERLNDELVHLDNQIKDESRALYREGSTRGIYTLYDGPNAYVKVTVKYGRDKFEPKTVAKWLKSHRQYDEDEIRDLIKTEEYVDVDLLRSLVDRGALPEEVLELGIRGEFQTPSVTIKSKIEESVTVRDEE